MAEIREFTYKLILADCGSNKIGVVKWIRNHRSISLIDAKKLVEDLPQVILSCSEPMGYIEAERKAREMMMELEVLGATVEWDYDYGDFD